jgi:hypothetical protein
MLFRRAKGLPDAHGNEPSLDVAMLDAGASIRDYETLTVHFWSNHALLGQPDLILHFSGKSKRSLVLLVEAKLWAEKSGHGEWDQLVRYAGILNDLKSLKLGLPREAYCFLVYLTPRDSLDEIEESARRLPENSPDRARLFRLRWQDIAAVAGETAYTAFEPARTVLADVSAFLRRRSLQYFTGFSTNDANFSFELGAGHFYTVPRRLFHGFSPPVELACLFLQKGGWVR